MLFKYLIFWLKSSNHHGVHSPFVYQWITKCLYVKPRIRSNKTQELVVRSIPYFGCINLKIIGNHALINRIKKDVPTARFNKKPCDLLFLEHPDEGKISSHLDQGHLHNNTIVVINNIHSNSKNEVFWKNVMGKAVFTVSIDLFHCGVLFLRKEQEKEHFTIRI